ncbi:MAG: VanZ family protein [Clostridia bacterium]|nr:VanZ family protein [Clostridia bacterium]MBP3650252.1 VanZ family protein [Clostridia bacterium]
MEQKWVRRILWIAVIAVCGLIFFFSAQSGEESADTSGKVVEWLIAILIKGYHMLAAAQQQEIFDTASLIVRKLAHFSEFALLGFLVRLLMQSYQVKAGASRAWVATSLYAVTDELHQLFSDARGASVVDVGIDSLGAAAGVGIACLLLWLILTSRKAKGEAPDNEASERTGFCCDTISSTERIIGLQEVNG